MKSNLRAALVALIVWQGQIACAWAQEQAASAPGAAQEPIVLRVGDQHWSAQRFGLLLEAGSGSDAREAEQLSSFAKNFAERRMLAAHAEAAGLASDPRIRERLALARDRVMAEEARALLERTAPIDEAAVQAEFAARPSSFDELQLSHILVRISDDDLSLPAAQRRTAAQALARALSIQQQLKRGVDFRALARRYSDDRVSKPEGGRLPSIFARDLRTDLAAGVQALKLQQVSAPLRSADGYHLIRLDDKASATFESSRRLMEFSMREAWAEQQAEKLREATSVSFDAAAWLAVRDGIAAGP